MRQVKRMLEAILLDSPELDGIIALEMDDGSIVSYKIIEMIEEEPTEDLDLETFNSCGEIKRLIQEFGQETIDECYKIIKKQIK